VARVVDAWMGSDGHCANLMNPVMEEFAVACVYNTANRSNYWVMDLAKPTLKRWGDTIARIRKKFGWVGPSLKP